MVAEKAEKVRQLVRQLNSAMADLSLDADAQNVKVELEITTCHPLGRLYPHPVVHVQVSAIHKF